MNYYKKQEVPIVSIPYKLFTCSNNYWRDIFMVFLILFVFFLFLNKTKFNKTKFNKTFIIALFSLIVLILMFNMVSNRLKIDETFLQTKHRYAVCIWGELRSINSTIDSFYSNLVEPLNADVFLMVQKTNDNEMDRKIDLFKERVIEKYMYDKPVDLNDVFKNYNELKERSADNYLINSNSQIYYNFHMIYENFGDVFESNYDYIILTRSDFLYLFPFPDLLNYSNESDTFWCYDGHEWWGVNLCLICVSSSYIKRYLNSFYLYLNDNAYMERLNSNILNLEKFAKMIFDDNGWNIGKIENNAFITADGENEKTTWGSITFSNEHNVFYKYTEQLNNTYTALEKYNNGKKWNLIETPTNKRLVLE